MAELRYQFWRWLGRMPWVGPLCRLEARLNHPYERPYHGYAETHWGRRSELVCTGADWLTAYKANE